MAKKYVHAILFASDEKYTSTNGNHKVEEKKFNIDLNVCILLKV